jgi:hypothetical protein
MQARTGSLWQSEVPVSVTGPRCITGPSMPHLGTLVTELMVASVHAASSVIGGVVYSAGLVGMWRGAQGACPLNSRGHSVVAGWGGVLGDPGVPRGRAERAAGVERLRLLMRAAVTAAALLLLLCSLFCRRGSRSSSSGARPYH